MGLDRSNENIEQQGESENYSDVEAAMEEDAIAGADLNMFSNSSPSLCQ